MEIPKHILKYAEQNKTSIGDNPCLPPEEENNFVVSLLSDYFDKITEKVGDINEYEMRKELGKLILQAIQLERNNIEALNLICQECIQNLFHIPDDTIEIDCEIVSNIDRNMERLTPEKTKDFTFDSIDDMDTLTGEIYKRRMLNAIIMGASIYYMKNFGYYFQKIFDIEPELPLLYKKIISLNEILMYLTKDTLNSKNGDAGKVDVYLGSDETLSRVEAKALMFPILFSEAIKGILEIAIAHGLPKNRKKAMYVISKADFKLAELWDMRIGCPLWENIVKLSKEVGYDIEEIGVNYFLMTISMMPISDFNNKMKEVFAGTNHGKEIVRSIFSEIEKNKDKDDFDSYMDIKSHENIPITDDEYFSEDELIVDSECPIF